VSGAVVGRQQQLTAAGKQRLETEFAWEREGDGKKKKQQQVRVNRKRMAKKNEF